MLLIVLKKQKRLYDFHNDILTTMDFNITVVGVGLLSVLIYVVVRYFKYPNKCVPMLLGVALFSELFLRLGYFVKISGLELNYDELAFFVFFFYSTIVFFSRDYAHRKSFVLLILLAFEMGVGLIIRLLSNQIILSVDHSFTFDQLFTEHLNMIPMQVTWYSLIVFLRILMFSFAAIIAIDYLNISYIDKYIKKLFPFLLIFLAFGVIEFLITNFISPIAYRNFMFILFGKGEATSTVPYLRAGIYAICLTTKEPAAACILLLVIQFMLTEAFLITPKRSERVLATIGIFVAIFLSITSLALTGIVGLVIYFLFILYCFVQKKRYRIFAFLIPIAMILTGFLIPVISPSIYSYISEKLSSASPFTSFYLNNPTDYSIFLKFGGSFVFREYSMLNALHLLIQAPLFGIGIGTNTSMSSVLALVSNIGLVGFALFFLFWKQIFRETGLIIRGLPFFFFFFFLLIQGNISDLAYGLTFPFLLVLSSLSINRIQKRYVEIGSFIIQSRKGSVDNIVFSSRKLYSSTN
jgi:hypothetical protein